ncbi:MAG: primosomal protein N', partial [Firmicutes bacterium]|nr:primosomal protein N' [Bacillota bacterium]
MNDGLAGVYILDAPINADIEYTYFIPRELSGTAPGGEAPIIHPGVFVIVPFGGGNRRKRGIVTSVFQSTEIEKCKPIISVLSESVSLNAEMLGLCAFIKEHTISTFGDAVRVIMPSGVLSRITDSYEVTDGNGEIPTSALSPKALYLYTFIKSRGKVSQEALRAEFSDTSELSELLSALIRRGFVIRHSDIKEAKDSPKITLAALAISKEQALSIAEGTGDIKLRSKRSREILSYLASYDTPVDTAAIKSSLGAVTITAQLKQLSDAGYIALSERPAWRNPFAGYDVSGAAPPILSEKQNECFQSLRSLYKSGEAKAALLFGITGSGKTSVIRAMIDEVTGDGKSVIILVPEIALTPQTVNIFCSNYGDRVAVIHSSLSAGERTDAWRRIKSGESDIVIGTRSAVFAPTENLGMIVIDEEQEHTYKSDSSPKYLAHDIARYRCAENHALMLLSSATPSLASYHKAAGGTYSLIKLGERYGGAQLPEVIVSDMRHDKREDSSSPIGTTLISELEKTLAAGKQAILFLNRRGYNNFLSCRHCGQPVSCPKCSVALTYHAKRRVNATESLEDYTDEHISAGHLMCHYCGYKSSAPTVCPSCGSRDLYYMG